MEITISEEKSKKINVSSRFFKHGSRWFYKLCNNKFAIEVYYNEETPEKVKIEIVKIEDVFTTEWSPIKESYFQELYDIAHDTIIGMITDEPMTGGFEDSKLQQEKLTVHGL